MLKRPLETKEIECSDCEGRGRDFGGGKCRLCVGDGVLKVTVVAGSLPEDPGGEWDAIDALRQERMPELFGSDDMDTCPDCLREMNKQYFASNGMCAWCVQAEQRTPTLQDLQSGKGGVN